MVISSSAIYRSLLAAIFLLEYLVTIFISLWMHQHPGEDHADVNGLAYHSHFPTGNSQHGNLYHLLDLIHDFPIDEDKHDVQTAMVAVHLFISGFPPIAIFSVPSPAFSVKPLQHSSLALHSGGRDVSVLSPFLDHSGYTANQENLLINSARKQFIWSITDLSPPLA